MGAQSVLASIAAQKLSAQESENCAICREAMRQGEWCRRLPCFHLFHQECIDRWIGMKVTCPLDNLRIDEMLAQQRQLEKQQQLEKHQQCACGSQPSPDPPRVAHRRVSALRRYGSLSPAWPRT